MIDAGALDRRIEILKATKTRSPAGQEQSVWTVAKTIYGQRLELRVADVARAAGRELALTSKFLIRYRSDLTVADRIRVDGVTYSVLSIDEPDRRATMVITVEGARS